MVNVTQSVEFTSRSSEQLTLLCYNVEDKRKIIKEIEFECGRIVEDVIMKNDDIIFNEYISLEYNDILVSVNVCGIKEGSTYRLIVVDIQLYYDK